MTFIKIDYPTVGLALVQAGVPCAILLQPEMYQPDLVPTLAFPTARLYCYNKLGLFMIIDIGLDLWSIGPVLALYL